MKIFKRKTQEYSTSARYIHNLFRDYSYEQLMYSAERLEEILKQEDLILLKKEKIKTKWYFRLTLPLFFIVVSICYLWLPILYICTGRWHYHIIFLEKWHDNIFGE